MKTKLEELKAALEVTTPGEWAALGFNSQGGQVACLLNNPDGLRLVSGNFERPDAKFIALSHNMIPQLLEAVGLLEDLTSTIRFAPNGIATIKCIARIDTLMEKLK